MPRGSKPSPPGTSPQRGTTHVWKYATGSGWQHGKTPVCPSGLSAASRRAWSLWFGSWWAAFWVPADVPALELLVEMYDRARLGELDAKLVTLLDRYGMTEKGRQDNRWAPQADAAPGVPVVPDEVAGRREVRRNKLA